MFLFVSLFAIVLGSLIASTYDLALSSAAVIVTFHHPSLALVSTKRGHISLITNHKHSHRENVHIGGLVMTYVCTGSRHRDKKKLTGISNIAIHLFRKKANITMFLDGWMVIFGAVL